MKKVVLEDTKNWNLKLVGFIAITGHYFNYGMPRRLFLLDLEIH